MGVSAPHGGLSFRDDAASALAVMPQLERNPRLRTRAGAAQLGRTAFYFPVLLMAAGEPYTADGPGPIFRAVFQRIRQLERQPH